MLFIIDNAVSDEGKEAIVSKLSQIVTDDGGQIEKVDKWGAKKLA